MNRALVLPLALLAACSVQSSMGGSGSSPSSTPQASQPGNIVVPDLFRMTKEQALAALEKAGFQGSVSYDDQLCGSVVEGQIIEVGQVCRQHPPAGREQGARLPISLLIQPEDPRHGNLGKITEWHLMPDVVGMPVEQAQKALRDAGFTDEKTRIDTRDEAGCKPNHVFKSYPGALERGGQNSDRVLFVCPAGGKPSDA